MRIIPTGCVYRGADVNTRHACHSLQLVVPVQGELEVLVDGVRYGLPAGAALLIPADVEQRIVAAAPRVTFMFDPEDRSAPCAGVSALVLSGATGRRIRDFAVELESTPLEDQATVEAALAEARTQLMAAGLDSARRLDARVEAALSLFRQPWLGLAHPVVAKQAAIAPDRLSHLFREQLGISAKRYALWIRTLAAIEQMIRGRTATQAAERTGFSDLAHFSRAARRYHGLPPSRLPLAQTRLFAGP